MAEEPAVDKRSDREGQEGLVGKSSCRVSLEARVRSPEPIAGGENQVLKGSTDVYVHTALTHM